VQQLVAGRDLVAHFEVAGFAGPKLEAQLEVAGFEVEVDR